MKSSAVLMSSFACALALNFPSRQSSYIKSLESNTMVFQLGGIRLLSDPVLGQLDFGIPLLYRGNQKVINGDDALREEAGRCDYVIISQGFDDHAHTPTLKKLRALRSDLRYLCPPSARAILLGAGIDASSITELAHGCSTVLTKGDTCVEVIATKGSLLGPPWQTRENGWVLRPTKSSRKFPSVYYEPHCMFDEGELAEFAGGIDVVVTPVVAQKLPGYTLVDGGEKALALATRVLRARALLPMLNGDLEQGGLLSQLVRTEGSLAEFTRLAKTTAASLRVLSAVPGVEVPI